MKDAATVDENGQVLHRGVDSSGQKQYQGKLRPVKKCSCLNLAVSLAGSYFAWGIFRGGKYFAEEIFCGGNILRRIFLREKHLEGGRTVSSSTSWKASRDMMRAPPSSGSCSTCSVD